MIKIFLLALALLTSVLWASHNDDLRGDKINKCREAGAEGYIDTMGSITCDWGII